MAVEPNTLSDDINLNYRVPENPIKSCQDEYIHRIVDELVLRTCILGIDARTLIKEHETKSRMVGYMHMHSLYEALTRVGVRLSESDFSMLLRKYQVYGMFIHVQSFVEDIEDSLWRLQNRKRTDFHPQTVIDELTRSNIKVPFPKLNRHDEKLIYPKEFFKCQDTPHPAVDRWPRRENKINTILRIQKYVNSVRRRPEEFFRGYDKIHCGKIRRAQFLSGLDSLASVTGHHTRLQISREEAEDIADIYSDPKTPGIVHWQRFIDDLYEVEAPMDIQHTPSIPIEENAAKELLEKLPGRFSGHVRFTKAELQKLEDAISWVKNKLKENKAQLLPFFKSYDKFNHGFVNPVQFRRVMSTCNINMSYEHGWILVKYYTEKEGFNYVKFVPEVGQEEALKPYWEPQTIQSKSETKEDVEQKGKGEFDPVLETEADTLEGILFKIQYIVRERRLRMAYYFEQFDELRRNSLDRHTFLQALTSTFDFPLSWRERNILLDAFCDPLERDLVLYRGFLQTVNEVDFQEGLEKAPLIVPLPYIPNMTARRRPYTKEETAALENIWKKLAGKCGLKDWDTFMEIKTVLNVRNDRTMTRLSLEKTLDRLRLLKLLSPYEFELLYESFGVHHLREIRFDWHAFLRTADLIYRKMKNLY